MKAMYRPAASWCKNQPIMYAVDMCLVTQRQSVSKKLMQDKYMLYMARSLVPPERAGKEDLRCFRRISRLFYWLFQCSRSIDGRGSHNTQDTSPVVQQGLYTEGGKAASYLIMVGFDLTIANLLLLADR